MTRLPFFVLADDFTGAAELAAIAHQAGLRAVVLTRPLRGRIAADVIVCDTGTRLASPAEAARKVGALARRLGAIPHAGIFKKTDSVLRGPVLVEIEACAAALGFARTLLVPCNPSLGRTIHDGRYLIGGQPLHQTAFAHDPHYPRQTSQVVALLGSGRERPVCLHPDDALPAQGVAVGEAKSPADVSLWAAQVDAQTLPAGGADFFRAWLMRQRMGRRAATAAPPTAGPTVLLSGTLTPPDPVTPLAGAVVALQATALPRPAALAASVRSHLRETKNVSVIMAPDSASAPERASAIDRTFVTLAGGLRATRSFQHLLIAGGTTAAVVLQALGWSRLDVVHVWGPGVVSLRPVRASRYLVTVKPGSYPWPAHLQNHFAPTSASAG